MKDYGENFVTALQNCAAVILFIGILAAFYQFSSLGKYSEYDELESIIRSFKISLGFYNLIGSVVLFILLRVIASMADNLIGIRVTSEKYNEEVLKTLKGIELHTKENIQSHAIIEDKDDLEVLNTKKL